MRRIYERKDSLVALERDWYTTGEAARELGVAPSTIRGAAMRGTLKVEVVAPRMRVIMREEVERYRREHLGKNWDARRSGVIDERNAAYHREYRARKKSEKAATAANTARSDVASVD